MSGSYVEGQIDQGAIEAFLDATVEDEELRERAKREARAKNGPPREGVGGEIVIEERELLKREPRHMHECVYFAKPDPSHVHHVGGCVCACGMKGSQWPAGEIAK